MAGNSVYISIILKFGGMASNGYIGFSTESSNMFLFFKKKTDNGPSFFRDRKGIS